MSAELIERRRFAILLLLALAIGFWLRVPYISEGLPFFYNEDEAHHFNRTVNMVKSGDLNPHYFHKPSLHFYLRIPVVAVSFLWSVSQGYIKSVKEIRTADSFGIGDYAFSASHPGIVKWNRCLSLFFSLVSIIFTALIAKQLFKFNLSAFFAAIIVAVSPEFIRSSCIIGVDGLMTMMVVLAVYLALKYLSSFDIRMLWALGLVSGLAVSSKYNALPIALLPVLVCAMTKPTSFASWAAVMLAPMLGFLIGSPYIISSIPLFLDQFGYEIWHYGIEGHAGHSAEPGIAQAMFYMHWLRKDALGSSLSILLAFGLFIYLLNCLKAETRRQHLIVLLFPVLFTWLMVDQKANFTRNMLVVIPFAGIFSAQTTDTILGHLRIKATMRRISYSILIILFCVPLILQVLKNHKEIKDFVDSRTLADAWLLDNQEPYLDTVIAGELQFPSSTYSRKGVSVIPGSEIDALDLYWAGYDRFVVDATDNLGLKIPGLLNLEKSFPGDIGPQRIVRNPQLDIYRIDVAQAQAREPKLHENKNLGEFGLNFVISTEMHEKFAMLDCADLVKAPVGAEEACWLKKRINFIRLNQPETLAHFVDPQGNLRLTAFVSSPWPAQIISVLASKLTLKGENVGVYREFDFVLPFDKLKELGGFYIGVTQVHSPFSQSLSEDKRRLGIALKGIRVNIGQ